MSMRKKTRSRAPAASGPSGQKLWLAIHGCGHASTRLVLDELPPDELPAYLGPLLRLVSIIEGIDGSMGRVDGSSRVCLMPGLIDAQIVAQLTPEMRHLRRRNMRCDIVEALAGMMAEFFWKGGLLGLFMMRGDIIRRTISGDLDVVDDFRFVRRHLEALNPPDPTAELRRLWDTTYGLLASEWPGVKR